MRDSHYVFTSESVTEGHPDKLCDRLSDAIVGRYLARDPGARVAAECAVSTGIVFVSVKYRSPVRMDVTTLVRDVVRRTGYSAAELDWRSCTVMTSIHEMTRPRIGPPGVDPETIVADGEGTVYGYACNHTQALMPLPIWLAHKIARRLAHARKDGLPYLSTDGKTQVSVELQGSRPRRIFGVTVIAASADQDGPKAARLNREVEEYVVRPAFQEEEIRPDERTRITINPEGQGNGGPSIHAGLTGRKTAVDTYGEFARHSGAALSGKDIGRIDRTGTYAARWIAKNVVAAGLADACEVQLSWAIGMPRPVSVHVETFGTASVSDDEIERRIGQAFDLSVATIIDDLELRQLPALEHGELFERLAAYGHVGRTDLVLPWEALDRVDRLKAA